MTFKILKLKKLKITSASVVVFNDSKEILAVKPLKRDRICIGG